MRIKIIVFISILFIIAFVQNDGTVGLAFLWFNFSISKKEMIAIFSLFAFIAGILAGRKKNNADTLSQEDRDYIN